MVLDLRAILVRQAVHRDPKTDIITDHKSLAPNISSLITLTVSPFCPDGPAGPRSPCTQKQSVKKIKS